MGAGTAEEGTDQTGKEHRAGWHKEISEPLSVKRAADLSILRQDTQKEAGLQEKNPMVVQYLH